MTYRGRSVRILREPWGSDDPYVLLQFLASGHVVVANRAEIEVAL